MFLRRIGYTPATDFHCFQRSMDRLFEQAASRIWAPEDADSIGTFTPPVDVRETADALEFYAELPGFSKDQIDIRVDQGNLILSGERTLEKKVDSGSFHRVERAHGKFHRVFGLPTSVDAEKITASLKDGVLRLTLPKAEKAKPRQIPVAVN